MKMGELPPALPADVAWRGLWQAAAAPYRSAGRFAWHFARGKLSRDPVFRALLERGDLADARRLVDIGCGQALLASLLASAAQVQREGRWPAGWPATPARIEYTGIELMPRDVARAEAALAVLQPPPRLVCGDMREVPLPPADAVVILDVLHYVGHAAQAALLARVHAALRDGGGAGRLLLRIGDASQQRGFRISQWVDRSVTRLRGHRAAPTWGRPLAQWVALLEQTGFRVQTLPMSRGTPFANVLLACSVAGAPR